MRNVIWIVLLAAACSTPQKQQEIEVVSMGATLNDSYPNKLSEWSLFEDMSDFMSPSEGTFLYTINSPLFTDYAQKARFIKLPSGAKMGYSPNEVLDFPDGSLLVKHFYYPADFIKPQEQKRILETRLLINKQGEWDAIVYQWNQEQTDADRLVLGGQVPIEWTDVHGELQRVNYTIPSQPQCKSCHEINGKMTPIGPSVRQLNRDNQLQTWARKGLLELPGDDLPKLIDYQDLNQTLAQRARAWLEINCAHCHRREGPAKNTGLYLLASEEESYRVGVKKPPVAAGKGSGDLKYSIVPGRPDESILVHRIASLEPGEMMPELGRKMNHEEGIQLIKQWIQEMEID